MQRNIEHPYIYSGKSAVMLYALKIRIVRIKSDSMAALHYIVRYTYSRISLSGPRYVGGGGAMRLGDH